MRENESVYNAAVRERVNADSAAARIIRSAVLSMPAVHQMLAFLYHVARRETVARSFIYENFFQAPFVQRFLELSAEDLSVLRELFGGEPVHCFLSAC